MKLTTIKKLAKKSVVGLYEQLLQENNFSSELQTSKEHIKDVRKSTVKYLVERSGVNKRDKFVKDSVAYKKVIELLAEIEQDIKMDLLSKSSGLLTTQLNSDNPLPIIDHVHSHVTPYDGFAGYQIDPKNKPYRIIQDKVRNGVDEATKEILSTVVKHQISPTIKTYVVTEVDKTIRARAEKVSNGLHIERVRYEANSVLQRLADEYYAAPEDIFTEGTELHKTILKVLLAWENATFGNKQDEVNAPKRPDNVKESVTHKVTTIFDFNEKQRGMSDNVSEHIDTVLMKLNVEGIASDMVCTKYIDALVDEKVTEWATHCYNGTYCSVDMHSIIDNSLSIRTNIENFVYERITKVFGGEIREALTDLISSNICNNLEEYHRIKTEQVLDSITEKEQKQVYRKLSNWYVAFAKAIKEGAKNI